MRAWWGWNAAAWGCNGLRPRPTWRRSRCCTVVHSIAAFDSAYIIGITTKLQIKKPVNLFIYEWTCRCSRTQFCSQLQLEKEQINRQEKKREVGTGKVGFRSYLEFGSDNLRNFSITCLVFHQMEAHFKTKKKKESILDQETNQRK